MFCLIDCTSEFGVECEGGIFATALVIIPLVTSSALVVHKTETEQECTLQFTFI